MGFLAMFGAFAVCLSIVHVLPAYSASCDGSTKYVTLDYHSTQTVSSPNYPLSYPSYTTCKWRFYAPYGYKVQLKFTSFDLYGYGSCNSLTDSLEVYDSSIISSSKLLGRFCGSTLPPTLTSGGRYLYLKFTSKSFQTSKGFLITVSTVSNAGCSSVALSASTSTSKNITTPNYPSNYPSSTSCQWTITAPPGYVVQITFKSFNTYGSLTGSCSSSYHSLKIYDSSYASSSNLLGQYCGSDIPATVVSRQKYMLLAFSSSSYYIKPGFKISYKAVKDPAEDYSLCSPFNSDYTNNDIKLKASSSSQYIQSPYYPNKYPSNIECTWIISASSSKKIKLTVTDVKLHNYYSYSCSGGDSLTVRDGSSSYSSQLKQFCGKSYPSDTVTSSGSKMWIRFKTNADNYFRGTQAGFKMKFVEIEESSSNAAMIVGIIVGVIIFFGLIVCCVCLSKRSGSAGHVQRNAATTSVQTATTTTTHQPPAAPPAPAPHYPLQQVGPPAGGVYQPPGGGYPPPAMAYPPAGSSYPQQPQGSYPPQVPPGGYPPYPVQPDIPETPPPEYPGPPAYPATSTHAYNPQFQGASPNPPYPPPQGVQNQPAVAYPPSVETKASAPPQF